MKLLNFNVIKLTACLILGICLAHFIEIPITLIWIFISISILALVIIQLYYRERLTRPVSFGFVTLIVMVFVGILTYVLNDDRQRYNHYTNLNLNLNETSFIAIKIKKRLKPDNYNHKFFANLIEIDSHKTRGKLLLNIKRDSLDSNLMIDDIYLIKTSLETIQKPLNPFQFDYNVYLEKRNVFHQVYLNLNELKPVNRQSLTISGYADIFRKRVNSDLKFFGFKNDVLSIINALLLGQRQDIDKEIYNNYVNSGTIHILAVSGLHVGIILYLMSFVLKPIERIKNGKTIKLIIILVALWCFALIAGFSASVTRAVTMFSVIAFAMHLKRPTNLYNTLTISAFFILLIKPMFLFDVGFQMSYLAVLAIVSIQPILYKLWTPKFYVLDKLWQIFTVTLAAQFGVVLISLFYFHQFPGLFFISNIVIIPFLGIILGFGILIIALALLKILPKFFVDIFSFIIDSLNSFVGWISKFEDFLLEDIPFNILNVVAAYIVILLGVKFVGNKSYKSVTHLALGICIFLMTLIITKFESSQNEFIIFNKSRHSILAQKDGNTLDVFHNMDSIILKNDKVIRNYKVGYFINNIEYDLLKSVYSIDNKKLLVIDSLGVFNIKTFKPEYVLLRNSPELNLKRVIDSLKPKMIIADASNYTSYLKQWKATCIEQKIPYHQTNEKGYYIIE